MAGGEGVRLSAGPPRGAAPGRYRDDAERGASGGWRSRWMSRRLSCGPIEGTLDQRKFAMWTLEDDPPAKDPRRAKALLKMAYHSTHASPMVAAWPAEGPCLALAVARGGGTSPRAAGDPGTPRSRPSGLRRRHGRPAAGDRRDNPRRAAARPKLCDPSSHLGSHGMLCILFPHGMLCILDLRCGQSGRPGRQASLCAPYSQSHVKHRKPRGGPRFVLLLFERVSRCALLTPGNLLQTQTTPRFVEPSCWTLAGVQERVHPGYGFPEPWKVAVRNRTSRPMSRLNEVYTNLSR